MFNRHFIIKQINQSYGFMVTTKGDWHYNLLFKSCCYYNYLNVVFGDWSQTMALKFVFPQLQANILCLVAYYCTHVAKIINLHGLKKTYEYVYKFELN